MSIHAAINERTIRRTFKERKPGSRGLTVIDRDLLQFSLKLAKNGTKTFFVRVLRPVGAPMTILGTADEMTAAQARDKAVAGYLDHKELKRLGAVLDRHREQHPWLVAAIRLLTLTGARLSEVIDLKWDEIGGLAEDGASARLEDSKTGPRTVWLGPEAARLLAALPRPEGRKRVFPDELTSDRLYTFWCGIREEAGLPGLCIHDCRHTWASQGVMNGVGLTTVGRLLGHRQRETTAIYAHLDDGALRDAAARAAAVIARAMGYRAEPPPMLLGETGEAGEGRELDRPSTVNR